MLLHAYKSQEIFENQRHLGRNKKENTRIQPSIKPYIEAVEESIEWHIEAVQTTTYLQASGKCFVQRNLPKSIFLHKHSAF